MKVINGSLLILSENEADRLKQMLIIAVIAESICKAGSPMWVFGNNLINCLEKGGECVDTCE